MARKKRARMALDQPAALDFGTEPIPASRQAPEPTPAPEPTTTIIEVPLGTVGEKEPLVRHVESRLRARNQQLALKRLLRGLQETGTTLADGRPVRRPGDVIRWLMEQISGSDSGD